MQKTLIRPLCNKRLILLNLMVLELSLPFLLIKRLLVACKCTRVKLKSDGTIKRYKSCLVILGYTKVEGENFNETFSPLLAKLVNLKKKKKRFINQQFSWSKFAGNFGDGFFRGSIISTDVFFKSYQLNFGM